VRDRESRWSCQFQAFPDVVVTKPVAPSVYILPWTPLRAARTQHTLTEIIMWGIFPSCAMTFRRDTVSSLPTMSSRSIGRYFSTLSRDKTV
jgi:hypothetical protein